MEMIGVSSSIMISGPSFEQITVMNVQRSAMEYKIAASVTTRSILVVVIFVVRLLATLRSIFQMRYASNPELNKLVAIVKAENAEIH
jgi:hypothetical protein